MQTTFRLMLPLITELYMERTWLPSLKPLQRLFKNPTAWQCKVIQLFHPIQMIQSVGAAKKLYLQRYHFSVSSICNTMLYFHSSIFFLIYRIFFEVVLSRVNKDFHRKRNFMPSRFNFSFYLAQLFYFRRVINLAIENYH